MRLKSRLTWLFCLLCATAPALFQQDTHPAADPVQDSDVRAIYSWLVTHSTDQDKLFLIAPETYQTDYPSERCLDVPADHAADFRQIRADFDKMAKEIMLHSALLSDSPIVRESYPGAEHLLLFSDVYFNRKRTVALVHVDWWCGGLCDRPMWIAFEKGDAGVWQMRPWYRCIVIV